MPNLNIDELNIYYSSPEENLIYYTTTTNSISWTYVNIQWENIFIPPENMCYPIKSKKIIKPYGIVAFLEKLNAK